MSAQNGKSPKFGLPTGKFLALSQKTNKPEPYEVTDQLSVLPPTKKRREQMSSALSRMTVGQAQLNIAYALSRIPVPPVPEQRRIVEPATDLKGVAAKRSADEYQRQLDAAAADFKQEMQAWKPEVQQWRENLTAASKTIDEHTDLVRKAEIDYDRAFFGESYDDLTEFFDDQDETLWTEFIGDVRKHWAPSEPDEGTCGTCGHVEDEEEAGKDTKSLTG